MTAAERQARRRKRVQQEHSIAYEALDFILGMEPQDAYSMPWNKRKALEDLQFRARMKRFDDSH